MNPITHDDELHDLHLAHHIIASSDTPITTLKLNALLYYAQAWNLVITGQPLTSTPIMADPCGPALTTIERRWGNGDTSDDVVTIHDIDRAIATLKLTRVRDIVVTAITDLLKELRSWA